MKNINNDIDVALKLFKILIFIANEMITKPKEIETFQEEIIPEQTKKYINDRGRKKIEKST